MIPGVFRCWRQRRAPIRLRTVVVYIFVLYAVSWLVLILFRGVPLPEVLPSSHSPSSSLENNNVVLLGETSLGFSSSSKDSSSQANTDALLHSHQNRDRGGGGGGGDDFSRTFQGSGSNANLEDGNDLNLEEDTPPDDRDDNSDESLARLFSSRQESPDVLGEDESDVDSQEKEEHDEQEQEQEPPRTKKATTGAALPGGMCAARSRLAEPPPIQGLPTSAADVLGSEDAIFLHKQNADALLKSTSQRDAEDNGTNADDAATQARVRASLPSSMSAITSAFAFKTCAVVGNGGALLYTRYGAAIDAHDTIWRVNQGPTKGYEAHVGSRTDLRVVNVLWASRYARGAKLEVDRGLTAPLPLERGVTLVASRANASDYDELFRGVRHGARLHTSADERKGGVVEFVGGVKRTDVSVLWLSHRVVGAARRWLEGYRRRLCSSGFGSTAAAAPRGAGGASAAEAFKGAPPSSGFVAAYTAIQLCSRVTLYGFGLQFAGETRRVLYHYYKGFGARDIGTQRDDGLQVHAWELEGAACEALARARKLSMCRLHPGNASRLWVRHSNERCGWPTKVGDEAARRRRADAMADELRWRFLRTGGRR
ncbi:sialyltransferase [Pycnococcus provasolii]